MPFLTFKLHEWRPKRSGRWLRLESKEFIRTSESNGDANLFPGIVYHSNRLGGRINSDSAILAYRRNPERFTNNPYLEGLRSHSKSRTHKSGFAHVCNNE